VAYVTQQESTNTNRLALIRKQIGANKGGEKTPPPETVITQKEISTMKNESTAIEIPQQSPAPTSEQVSQASDRRRHTLYFSDKLNKDLERTFRQVAHDIFPQTIEKSDFLEACFLYCLEHLDDIRSALREAAEEP